MPINTQQTSSKTNLLKNEGKKKRKISLPGCSLVRFLSRRRAARMPADGQSPGRPSCSIFFLFLAGEPRTFTFMAEKRSPTAGVASFRGDVSVTRKVSRPTITGAIPFPQPRGRLTRRAVRALYHCHNRRRRCRAYGQPLSR